MRLKVTRAGSKPPEERLKLKTEVAESGGHSLIQYPIAPHVFLMRDGRWRGWSEARNARLKASLSIPPNQILAKWMWSPGECKKRYMYGGVRMGMGLCWPSKYDPRAMSYTTVARNLWLVKSSTLCFLFSLELDGPDFPQVLYKWSCLQLA